MITFNIVKNRLNLIGFAVFYGKLRHLAYAIWVVDGLGPYVFKSLSDLAARILFQTLSDFLPFHQKSFLILKA